MADITVVPLAYQSTADLMPAVKTVDRDRALLRQRSCC